jgi:hypothetical protein
MKPWIPLAMTRRNAAELAKFSPSEPLSRLGVRDELAVRIGPAPAHFAKLRFVEAQVVAMSEVVHERGRGRILLVGRKLFHLT